MQPCVTTARVDGSKNCVLLLDFIKSVTFGEHISYIQSISLRLVGGFLVFRGLHSNAKQAMVHHYACTFTAKQSVFSHLSSL